uniref:Uncharacterized protein n=1 Tax=Macrostomum lignano TaxID=282301 RepID=A0A1I8F4B3_9PLAT
MSKMLGKAEAMMAEEVDKQKKSNLERKKRTAIPLCCVCFPRRLAWPAAAGAVWTFHQQWKRPNAPHLIISIRQLPQRTTPTLAGSEATSNVSLQQFNSLPILGVIELPMSHLLPGHPCCPAAAAGAMFARLIGHLVSGIVTLAKPSGPCCTATVQQHAELLSWAREEVDDTTSGLTMIRAKLIGRRRFKALSVRDRHCRRCGQNSNCWPEAKCNESCSFRRPQSRRSLALSTCPFPVAGGRCLRCQNQLVSAWRTELASWQSSWVEAGPSTETTPLPTGCWKQLPCQIGSALTCSAALIRPESGCLRAAFRLLPSLHHPALCPLFETESPTNPPSSGLPPAAATAPTSWNVPVLRHMGFGVSPHRARTSGRPLSTAVCRSSVQPDLTASLEERAATTRMMAQLAELEVERESASQCLRNWVRPDPRPVVFEFLQVQLPGGGCCSAARARIRPCWRTCIAEKLLVGACQANSPPPAADSAARRHLFWRRRSHPTTFKSGVRSVDADQQCTPTIGSLPLPACRTAVRVSARPAPIRATVVCRCWCRARRVRALGHRWRPFDLGLCSTQLIERGAASPCQLTAPLDMRMGLEPAGQATRQPPPISSRAARAATRLAALFRAFGEEPMARRLGPAWLGVTGLSQRARGPSARAKQLADCLADRCGSARRKDSLAAVRTGDAIAVAAEPPPPPRSSGSWCGSIRNRGEDYLIGRAGRSGENPRAPFGSAASRTETCVLRCYAECWPAYRRVSVSAGLSGVCDKRPEDLAPNRTMLDLLAAGDMRGFSIESKTGHQTQRLDIQQQGLAQQQGLDIQQQGLDIQQQGLDIQNRDWTLNNRDWTTKQQRLDTKQQGLDIQHQGLDIEQQELDIQQQGLDSQQQLDNQGLDSEPRPLACRGAAERRRLPAQRLLPAPATVVASTATPICAVGTCSRDAYLYGNACESLCQTTRRLADEAEAAWRRMLAGQEARRGRLSELQPSLLFFNTRQELLLLNNLIFRGPPDRLSRAAHSCTGRRRRGGRSRQICALSGAIRGRPAPRGPQPGRPAGAGDGRGQHGEMRRLAERLQPLLDRLRTRRLAGEADARAEAATSEALERLGEACAELRRLAAPLARRLSSCDAAGGACGGGGGGGAAGGDAGVRWPPKKIFHYRCTDAAVVVHSGRGLVCRPGLAGIRIATEMELTDGQGGDSGWEPLPSPVVYLLAQGGSVIKVLSCSGRSLTSLQLDSSSSAVADAAIASTTVGSLTCLLYIGGPDQLLAAAMEVEFTWPTWPAACGTPSPMSGGRLDSAPMPVGAGCSLPTPIGVASPCCRWRLASTRSSLMLCLRAVAWGIGILDGRTVSATVGGQLDWTVTGGGPGRGHGAASAGIRVDSPSWLTADAAAGVLYAVTSGGQRIQAHCCSDGRYV